MKIAIVSINYNGAEDSINLANILKNQTDHDFSFILVENGSEVGDIESLNHYERDSGWEGFILVKNGQNLGFSGGCNVGIKKALEMGSDWVILLNNDTSPKVDFTASIRAFLGAKKGLVAIPLDEGQGMAYLGLAKWLKPALGHIYAKDYNDGLCHGSCGHNCCPIYAVGGGVAIHKDVFRQIGFFDENYFLYFEDADFSIRAQRAGFDLSVARGISIQHKVQASTKKLGSPLLLRYHYRNALYFNRKLGPWWAKILLWPWSIWIIKKQLFKLMIGRDKDRSRAILSGVLDFYKNKMGKIENQRR